MKEEVKKRKKEEEGEAEEFQELGEVDDDKVVLAGGEGEGVVPGIICIAGVRPFLDLIIKEPATVVAPARVGPLYGEPVGGVGLVEV